MLRDESATTSLQTSHNSLRELGQFGGRVGGRGGGGGGGSGAVDSQGKGGSET